MSDRRQRALGPRSRAAWLVSLLPDWRRDALRTTLWLVPAVLVGLAVLMFGATYALDREAYDGHLSLPSWVNSGGADAARQVLTAVAAAVITVAGVVFSVVIVALTLASQQFGPRMLRNFIRDLGTQITLGMFMATFAYSVLVLGSISSAGGREFVPHASVTFDLGLLFADLVVLIYFIHHVAVSIQLNEVIAGIGEDLTRSIEDEFAMAREYEVATHQPSGLPIVPPGAVQVLSTRSGFLQAVSLWDMIDLATRFDAVIEILNRPGHFVVAGRPLARVWPATAAPAVADGLDRAHVTGRHRTLIQDPIFAIDQLVEIAIRALSPAVNDTFTALTCIDWLTASLCCLPGRNLAPPTYRDEMGVIRLVEPALTFQSVIDRAFDKIATPAGACR